MSETPVHRYGLRSPLPTRIAAARALTISLLSLIVVVASLGHLAPPGASAQSRPNFVVILLDDLDADSVRHMPAVNRLLVDEGAAFTHFFATTPLCCPSRASLLRGQYAHNHGVLRNTGENAGFEAFVQSGHERATLATRLHDAGYQTALIGKYLNGYAVRDDPAYIPPGWDVWAAGVDHAAYDAFNYDLNVNGEIVRYGRDDADYMTDVLSGYALDFLASATSSSDPFLLYLSTYAPHAPSRSAPRHQGAFAGATAPRTPAFNERQIKDKPDWVRSIGRMGESRLDRIDAGYRNRLESLLAVDETVEAIVGQLEQTRHLESTYLLFLSDNGYFLGEHRQPHGKDAPYDAASRIPLVVRGPGIPSAVSIDALALNIDLMPTILDLAGIPAPAFVDGRSLTPLLTGGGVASERQAILIEGFGKETESLEGKESATPPFQALRGHDLLYVEYETGERELYNLRKDPFQLANIVADADKANLRTLSRQLQGLSSCAGPSCLVAENTASPRAAGKSERAAPTLKSESKRGEKVHPRKNRTARSAPAGETLTIAEANDSEVALPILLSRRQAKVQDLSLRVHVATVESPGALVAALELPGASGRERLSSVPVQKPGWVTLNIAPALGDTRQITVSLRGRAGAALAISGPDSSFAPEIVADPAQRARNDTGQQDQADRSRARKASGDDRGRHQQSRGNRR